MKVDESPDEKIHVSYSGTIEKEKSDIAVVQKDITLNILQSDKQQNMAEQFSAGKPGEITVYLPKGIEIPFKISNGSGNMQIDNISIQELSLVNTYVQGHVKTLALNDLCGNDFDVLTYTDMLFWIEWYNKEQIYNKLL